MLFINNGVNLSDHQVTLTELGNTLNQCFDRTQTAFTADNILSQDQLQLHREWRWTESQIRLYFDVFEKRKQLESTVQELSNTDPLKGFALLTQEKIPERDLWRYYGPLSDHIHGEMTSMITLSMQVDPAFYKIMTEDPILSMKLMFSEDQLPKDESLLMAKLAALEQNWFKRKVYSVIIEFFKSYTSYKNNDDSTLVCAFLEKWSERIAKIEKEENPNPTATKKILFWLEYCLTQFKAYDFHSLEKPVYVYIQPDYQPSEQEKFRIALLASTHLIGSIRIFVDFSKELAKKAQKKSECAHNLQFENFNFQILSKTSTLTSAERKIAFRAFLNILKKYNSYLDQMGDCADLVLTSDISKNYQPIVVFDQKDVQSALYHVCKNRNTFENLLPRVEEAVECMLTCAEEIAVISHQLFNASAYFIYGDLSPLQERLANEKSAPRRHESILCEEIARFNHDLVENPDFHEKVKSTILSEDVLKQHHDYFLAHEAYSRECIELCHVFLDNPLNILRAYQKNLFSLIPVESHPREKEPTTHSPLFERIEKEKEKEVEKPEPISQTGIVKAVLAPTATHASPLVQLQQMRELFVKRLNALAEDCIGFGTKEALLNAKNHFEDLLFTLHRFLAASEQPVSAEQFFCFATDSLRDGILLVEQTLSALDRESNQLQNQTQLDRRLSHDLQYIFFNCRCKAGPLPLHLKSWLREISSGEILLRELNDCSLGISSFQNLLVETRELISTDSQDCSLAAQRIISGLLQHLQNTAELFGQLQLELEAAKPFHKRDAAIEFASEFPSQFSGLRTSLLQQFSHLRVAPRSTPAFQHTISIHQLLEELQQRLPHAPFDFDAIQQNFLVHLEQELANQHLLQPLGAHSFLSKFLLFDQMIAEEALWNLIRLQEHPPELDPHAHNLLALMQALGMTETDFTEDELTFLKRGKETRQLVRYPASYEAFFQKKQSPVPSSMHRLLTQSRAVASRQNMTKPYSLGEGYTAGKSKAAN